MKYTIEIDKDKVFTDGQNNKLYRAKGFNSLVFDKCGLDKLEPVEKAWESELEKAKLVAYKDGFEHGKFWDIKENAENRQGYYNDGYNNAIEDLAHAMKVYFPLNAKERLDYFGINTHVDTYAIENPKDLIAKAKAYEEKKNAEEDIRVGDIIYSEMTDSKAIIISFDAWDNWNCIDTCGTGFSIDESKKEFWKKIGHIDEVSQLLAKLRGENNENQ